MAPANRIKVLTIGLVLAGFLLYMEISWLTPKPLIWSWILQTNEGVTLEYMISPQPCPTDYKLYMLVIVGSHPDHKELRDVIRTTWGNPHLTGFPFKLIFTFGKLTNESQQRNLQQESMRHGDILQGTKFTDSYHNITHRDIMSFQWVLNYCPKTKFIMKADDDIALNIYHLIDVLEKSQYAKSKMLVACSILIQSATVVRYGHYAVSYDDFPDSTYPDYCSGWTYVLNRESMSMLVNMSKIIHPIWMNDVYFTGILTKAANISLTNLHFYYTFYSEDTAYIIQRDQVYYYQILPIDSKPNLMRKIQTIFYNQSVIKGLPQRISDNGVTSH